MCTETYINTSKSWMTTENVLTVFGLCLPIVLLVSVFSGSQFSAFVDNNPAPVICFHLQHQQSSSGARNN